MIVEYDKKYDEQIKDLLVELQEYIQNIDIEKYNILTEEYREAYFNKTMTEVKLYNGKLLLSECNGKINGLVVGLINNDEVGEYDFKAPKRGRISELVVSKSVRSKGIGSMLLKEMEEYLYSVGCKSILLGVFAYNAEAVKFYEKHGYHTRMIEMIKVNQ